jgi:hypothetical protein
MLSSRFLVQLISRCPITFRAIPSHDDSSAVDKQVVSSRVGSPLVFSLLAPSCSDTTTPVDSSASGCPGAVDLLVGWSTGSRAVVSPAGGAVDLLMHCSLPHLLFK